MKKTLRKITCLLLSLVIVAGLASGARAYEMGDPWKIDLTALLDNPQNRQYVQMMLDYYLRNDLQIQQTLEDGYCAMFLFEGCSDNMDAPELSDLSYYRVTAGCFVLKLDEAGEPQLIYFNENCSTIPDRALEYGAWQFEEFGDVGPATICDGTYELYSVKHMGKYEALHMRDSEEDGELSAVYMIPEGYVVKDAELINIHTRTSNHTSGLGMWSAGCMLIGDGDFGQFTEMMDCTYYAIYDEFEIGNKVGTVTINRFFFRDALYDMYENQTAVDTILTQSRCMHPEIYLEQCHVEETYPDGMQMRMATEAELMTLPCGNDTDARSIPVEVLSHRQELTVTAKLTNTRGNTWYQVICDGQSGYVYHAYLEQIPPGNWFTRLIDGLFG